MLWKAFDMKKNFCSYRPAELVKGEDRWYIKYYTILPGGKKKRYRPTFDLNRIKSITQRKRMADKRLQWLNDEVLPGGYNHLNYPDSSGVDRVGDAIKKALAVKQDELRPNSYVHYESKAKIFMEWVELAGLLDLPITHFDTGHVRKFMSWYDKRVKPAAVTYNITCGRISALWYVLIKDKVLRENPWNVIKHRKVYGKNRRNFTDHERRVMYNEIKKVDPLLFLGVLIQYWCLIRPIESRRLKVENFDLKRGLISIRGDQAKNHTDTKYATIPADVLPYFREMLAGVPSHYYVFGKGWAANPHHAAGKNEMNRRHRLILQRLHKEGILQDITGLSYYSWKDTAVTNHAKVLTPFELKDLGRWSNMETILKYYHTNQINLKVRKMKDDMAA